MQEGEKLIEWLDQWLDEMGWCADLLSFQRYQDLLKASSLVIWVDLI